MDEYVDSPILNARVGYRLYACNHYHLGFWRHPAEKTPRGYAEHMLAVMRAVIVSDRADCIAHPMSSGYLRDRLEDGTTAAAAVTDAELGDVLALGRRHGVAWELSVPACLEDPAFARRFWRLGREAGAEFRLGTDAHALDTIDPSPRLADFADVLA